jgi:serine/threonine protein kinase/Tol biopolymer transport system component
MALTSGTKLGPYEIQSPLGAGGMGEVYRARDTRLDRTVAIKVLPAHLSSDPELKQRLEREARAISSLQHANICTLYDIGTQSGTEFLVMEYLEGQTLAERLQKGPLPVDQVLKIGTEVAQALEKAHSQGIIHRDLKPANIMLTKAGAKLMDFGLAKPRLAIVPQAAGPFPPSTPTMNVASLISAASPLTQKGSIVGTFQYMAPEVLQGSEADARSDLFSYGCVLYEMVTGHRAFEGKSQLSVLTAILEKEPEPVSVTRPLTPPMLDRVIRACLAKDPVDRMQTAHDVAMNLRWAVDFAPDATAKSPPQFKRDWAAGFGALLLALIAAGGLLGYRWAQSPNQPVSLHSEIQPPEKFLFDATGDVAGMPVLSPQGDRLAFVAHSGDSKLLWVRSLSNDAALPLDGTSGAAHPFWSPDGRYLGFFAGGKLMRIPAAGGPIATLADAPNPRGGTWSINDIIVFEGEYIDGLMKVNAQGGAAEPATELDRTKHSTHRWPWFLPDGKHFVFLATNHTGGDPKQNGIYFGSLDSKETRLIVNAESGAEYASGYLLYRANTALVAQPFDPQSGTLEGPAIPLLNNLRDDVGVWRSIFSVSQNGFLTYQIGSASYVKDRLIWFDRAGKSVPTCEPDEKGIADVRLSPDNKKAAYGGGTAMWTCDLERNTRTRVTFGNQLPRQQSWSPDGKSLMFAVPVAKGGGVTEVRSTAADGSGSETTVIPAPNNGRPISYPAWTPDRRYLTYLWGDGSAPRSLWMVAAAGESKPAVIVQPPSAQSNLYNYRVSPDGHWVAYTSDESGQQEVYMTSFPGGSGKWKVSVNGGSYPAWSGTGKELFYQDIVNDFFVCPITAKGSDVEVGKPQHLFHASTPGIGVPFDVSLDGKRLLVNHADEEMQVPLHLVTNWLADLKK